MTSEDIDGRLRHRVCRTLESLPDPDRGRLARIEQGVLERGAHRGRVFMPVRYLLWAALLGGAVAATAGVAYWSQSAPPTNGSIEDADRETVPQDAGTKDTARPDAAAPTEAAWDSRPRDRIIHQR